MSNAIAKRKKKCSDIQLNVACNVLRNLHASSHAKTCFKKDLECRFQIPKLPRTETVIIFDINDIKWPEWYGFEKRRNVFATEIKRKPCDIFANANNKILTKQGWNNNVMLGADGGSVYYMSCHSFKDNKQEDSEIHCKSCLHMTKKIADEIKERSERLDVPESEEDQILRLYMGLRSLMGSVLMSLRTHRCSAPLAACVVPNESRFMFSHDFTYFRLNSYIDQLQDEYLVGALCRNN